MKNSFEELQRSQFFREHSSHFGTHVSQLCVGDIKAISSLIIKWNKSPALKKNIGLPLNMPDLEIERCRANHIDNPSALLIPLRS